MVSSFYLTLCKEITNIRTNVRIKQIILGIISVKSEKDIYEFVSDAKKALKLNNKELGNFIGKSGDTMRKAMNRQSLSKFEITVLIHNLFMKIKSECSPNSEIFLKSKTAHEFLVRKNREGLGKLIDNIDNFNEGKITSNIAVNEPSQIYPTKAGSIIEELPNGKFLLTVPMVPYKAHATYISEFTDADFIQDLTKVSFIVDRVPRGKYQAFEIINDSMNDATLDRPPSRDAILSGDIVLGRELGRQHWTSKLNINGYPYWIIVTHHNIICKEIVHHDIEKGIITCHSLNSSPEFQDFDLKLDECHQLFNIIKKQV